MTFSREATGSADVGAADAATGAIKALIRERLDGLRSWMICSFRMAVAVMMSCRCGSFRARPLLLLLYPAMSIIDAVGGKPPSVLLGLGGELPNGLIDNSRGGRESEFGMWLSLLAKAAAGPDK